MTKKIDKFIDCKQLYHHPSGHCVLFVQWSSSNKTTISSFTIWSY